MSEVKQMTHLTLPDAEGQPQKYEVVDAEARRAAQAAEQKVDDAIGTIAEEARKAAGEVTDLAAEKIAEVERVGEQVLESIPEDYTALIEDVAELSDAVSDKISRPLPEYDGKYPRALNGNVKWVDLDGGVPDGSITEQKLTDEMRARTIKEYVTMEMFGAVGDGVTDDTYALQNAVNSGKPIYIDPTKKYKFNSPVSVDVVEKLVLRSDNNTGYVYREINIQCDDSLFVASAKKTLKVDVSGVKVYCTSSAYGEANDACVFENIELAQSNIDRCTFVNFGTIIKGSLHDLANVTRSNFVAITNGFIAATDEYASSDSVIDSCYISGFGGANPTVFKCANFTRMRVTNNYIDFFKTVLGDTSKYMQTAGTIIVGNVFDGCWRINGASVGDISGTQETVISGNTFLRFNEAFLKTVFPNPDAEMADANGIKDYGCFATPQKWRKEIDGFSVTDNVCHQTDVFINVKAYKLKRLHVSGNMIGDAVRNVEDYSPDVVPEVYIDAHDFKMSETEPTNPGASYKNYFPGMKCIYDRKIYQMSDSGQWEIVVG